MAEEEKKEKAADADAAAPDEGAKARKKKILLFAIIGALVVLGGGGGAFFFLSKGKQSNEEVISKETVEHPADAAHADAAHEGKEKADVKKDEHGDKPKAAGENAGEGKTADGNGEGKVESKEGAAGTDAATGAPKEEKKADSTIDFGETFKLQSFNLNLGNALENRYIRIEISLEYRGGESHKKELEKRLPQLRDAIIGIIQRKTREFLLSPDGKEALRKEVLIRINRYMTQKIDSVFITDLLIE